MHLHIGKNNVIGRSFASKPNVKVVSHSQLEYENLYSYDTISISAFDSAAKVKFIGVDDVTKNIVANTNSSAEIIYFSSARVLTENLFNNYHFYIKNKLEIENFLFDHHEKSKIVYLPNIIPKYASDRCDFIDMFLDNLRDGTVKFDSSLESSWNFISSEKLVEACLDKKFTARRTVFLNHREITVADLIRFAKQYSNKPIDIEIGSDTMIYPDERKFDCEKIYSDFENTTDEFLWIRRRQQGYINDLW